MSSYFVYFIYFFLFTISSYSQNISIRGQVREFKTGVQLPFVTIKIDDSIHALTDVDGNFHISLKRLPDKISFFYDMYRTETVINPRDTLNIDLIKSHYFSYKKGSSKEAFTCISNIVNNRKNYDPKYLANYSYSTYNKVSLTTTKSKDVNRIMGFLKGKIPIKLYNIQDDQHLFILESLTEKKYIDDLHQQEDFVGAKSSSITIPQFFLQTSQLHAFSIYDNYLDLNHISYLSPLSKSFATRYTFNISDKINITGDTILIIKFHAAENTKFPSLKGYLFISSYTGSIVHYIASPMQEGETEIKAMQTLDRNPATHFFPQRTKTQVISRNTLRDVNYILESNTYFSNLNLQNSKLKKKDFNEIVLDYRAIAEKQDDQYWREKRSIPLSKRDSATYRYYEVLDKKHVLQSLLVLGADIASGFVPVKKVNLETDKLFNTNLVEKIRLGVGLHTNSRFSEKIVLGGYAGYGFRDKKIKYGLNFSSIIKNQAWVSYKFNFKHDLQEAGSFLFSFDRYQYSSEVIRKLRLKIMDFTTEVSNSILLHPVKYMDLNFSYSFSSNWLTYEYKYKDELVKRLRYEELGFGMRYAFGEKIIRFLNNEKILGSTYPTIYLQLIKGVNLYGIRSYSKFNVRVEQNFTFLKMGTTTIQLAGGATNADNYYSKLYNMKGSLKSFSIVVHNAFETMAYNEFLSNKFIALYITHNFGRIFFSNPHMQPSVSILHNTGIGLLEGKENHLLNGQPVKSMEKGYIESGTFIDNVIVINITGLKIGLGAGIFYRYGPYAYAKGSQNVVFKFSTNFLF